MRLLTSSEFDSRAISSVVLAGDNRLLAKLRSPDLQPIASRIRQRLLMARAAARNSTVTAALHELVREGRIERGPGGRYRYLGSLSGDAAMQTTSANG